MGQLAVAPRGVPFWTRHKQALGQLTHHPTLRTWAQGLGVVALFASRGSLGSGREFFPAICKFSWLSNPNRNNRPYLLQAERLPQCPRSLKSCNFPMKTGLKLV